VEKQVGLLASMGLSHSKFQKLRLAFRGAVFGMASIHALRKSRATLSREPSAAVSEDDTGAHLVNLRAALERRLVDLCQSKVFVERLVCDEQGRPVSQTRDFEVPPKGGPPYPDECPPPDMRDVQFSFGLDKGGTPSSVKVVMGLLNQAHPHRLAKSMLAAVCPCENDKHEDVEKMLRTHVPAIQDLLLNGFVLDGHRRAVRLFLTGDYPVICILLGHNGPNETLPCVKCLGTKVPIKA